MAEDIKKVEEVKNETVLCISRTPNCIEFTHDNKSYSFPAAEFEMSAKVMEAFMRTDRAHLVKVYTDKERKDRIKEIEEAKEAAKKELRAKLDKEIAAENERAKAAEIERIKADIAQRKAAVVAVKDEIEVINNQIKKLVETKEKREKLLKEIDTEMAKAETAAAKETERVKQGKTSV